MIARFAADALEVTGGVCLVVGAALIYEPAGWIVGGVALVAKAFELDVPGSGRGRGAVK